MGKRKSELPTTIPPLGSLRLSGLRAKVKWGERVKRHRKQPKKLYEIELVDTKFFSHSIKRGYERGRYPLDALRKFAKRLPPDVDLQEMRTPEYSRYVFLHSEVKGGQ